MNIREKFQATRRELLKGLIERDREVDAALTALVSQQHLLLVGPPGTGKSLLADQFTAWTDGTKFSILLTKFSTPEEAFGPVSLKGLKEDKFRRVTTGKLPEASIAFIDEIFKASSAILNTLLNILNERVYRNDGTDTKCPLLLAIAASNEWPQGAELSALFDRFLFRRTVQPIATNAGLNRLLWQDFAITLSTSISPEEIGTAHRESLALEWSDEARDAYLKIIRELRAAGIRAGDRRLRLSALACQARAWLCDAEEIRPEHLEVLTDTAWDDPTDQPRKCAEIVMRIANPDRMRVNALLAEATELIDTTPVLDLVRCNASCTKLREIHRQLAGMPTAREEAVWIMAEIKRMRLASAEAL